MSDDIIQACDVSLLGRCQRCDHPCEAYFDIPMPDKRALEAEYDAEIMRKLRRYSEDNPPVTVWTFIRWVGKLLLKWKN